MRGEKTRPGGLRVLVVDDEVEVREFLAEALAEELIHVDVATSAREALEAVEACDYDAIVLDVLMPCGSGMQALAAIRERSDVPVLMLSARDDHTMSVVALEFGADDCLAKPVSARELALRIRMAVDRQAVEKPAGLHLVDTAADAAGLVVDSDRRVVYVDGDAIELTRVEFDLLAHMAASPGKVFTRVELLRDVWAAEPDWQSVDTVTEHIYRLRQKLPTPQRGEWIETVRGAGYRFIEHHPLALAT